MNYIYLIKSLNDSHYKIGVSKNPKKRLVSLQTGNSSTIELIHTHPTEKAYQIENILHRKLSHFNKKGEWFDLSVKEEVSFIDECIRIENNLKLLIDSGNNFIK